MVYKQGEKGRGLGRVFLHVSPSRISDMGCYGVSNNSHNTVPSWASLDLISRSREALRCNRKYTGLYPL